MKSYITPLGSLLCCLKYLGIFLKQSKCLLKSARLNCATIKHKTGEKKEPKWLCWHALNDW